MAGKDQKQDQVYQNSSKNTDHHYPRDKNSYEILDQIGGRATSANNVFKAICIPMNSSVVAVKIIDLDQKSKAYFGHVLSQPKTDSPDLISHPNILKPHCSFSVETSLWVVMPFISGGSLRSIIASSFPGGLSEPCIAAVLKEILTALSYLHGQGHFHGDIKAGNILIDSNGSVKLADFGFSSSVYECNKSFVWHADVAGTPYWVAPEVIYSYRGYNAEAEIWSFGIIAMELAYGGPPLSYLPPSKSLIKKINKRLQFCSDTTTDGKKQNFSESFKEMVGLCIHKDVHKRASAENLLTHPFFESFDEGPADFLVKNLLEGLPNLEERFEGRDNQIQRPISLKGEDDSSWGENENPKRIIGWKYNEERFELDPVCKGDMGSFMSFLL